MSRTYRRKNYEATLGNSWSRAGTKLGGTYAVIDVIDGMLTWRPPSSEELVAKIKWMHGESATNLRRSPNRLYRRFRLKEWRAAHKSAVRSFVSYGTEVVIHENPISCWWDWN